MTYSTCTSKKGKNELSLYFAYNVGREMKLRGWTQIEFARRAGWPQPRISELLHGRRNYSLATVNRLAKVFNVPAVNLLAQPPDTEVLARIKKIIESS